MDSNTITRAALGTTFSLGDLYNARQNTFLHISSFQKTPSNSAIALIDSNFTDIQFSLKDTYSDKFSKLDVSPEQQVSILADTLPLKGSGLFITDPKISAKILRSSLIHTILTKDEYLNIYHEDLKSAFSPEALQNPKATHIVVGISWGVNSIVTCLHKNKENRDVKQVEQYLAIQLKKLSRAISGKGTTDFTDLGDTGIPFQVKIYGDVLPSEITDMPITLQGALDFLKKVPKFLEATNQGKGKPITYKLLPIGLVRKYLGLSMKLNSQIWDLNTTKLLQIVHRFDEISIARQNIEDFWQDVETYQELLASSIVREVEKFRNQMTVEESFFKTELGEIIQAIRSGEENAEKLDNLLEKTKCSNLANVNLGETSEAWKLVKEQIHFLRLLIISGIICLRKGEQIETKILQMEESTIYVLFYNHQVKISNPEKWQRNLCNFLKQSKIEKEATFFAVDTQIHKTVYENKGEIVVKVFKQGRVGSMDLFGNNVKNAPTELLWVPGKSSMTDATVPDYAVLAGTDSNGNKIYICRAIHEDFLLPGKLVVTENSREAYVAYHKGHAKKNYEILVCPPWLYCWVKFTGSSLPDHAVVAGSERGYPLYAGRTFSSGKVEVGKCSVGNRGQGNLWYAYGTGSATEQRLANNPEVLALTC